VEELVPTGFAGFFEPLVEIAGAIRAAYLISLVAINRVFLFRVILGHLAGIFVLAFDEVGSLSRTRCCSKLVMTALKLVGHIIDLLCVLELFTNSYHGCNQINVRLASIAPCRQLLGIYNSLASHEACGLHYCAWSPRANEGL